MAREKAQSILIADDHPVVRRGLRTLLELHSGWKIRAEASCGSEAIRKTTRFKPDVALLDISMPDLTGLEAAAEILRISPKTKVLILSMHYSEEFIRAAVKAGARGYVLKSDAEADLITAIGVVVSGGTFFTNAAADFFRGVRPAPVHDEIGPDSLTRREHQVLRLIAEGRTNKQLAADLGISCRTAENHRACIMRKLNLSSLSHLVRYAIRHKIVAP